MPGNNPDPPDPTTLSRARALRQPQTPAETRLWAGLRDRRLAGCKFRRQHPIPPYIVDFYCAAARLVVELDGDSHADRAGYDAARTAALAAAGYRVLRFSNLDVRDSLEGVLQQIQAACEAAGRDETADE